MKTRIRIFCINAEGRIVCGMVTSDIEQAREYERRKNERGFVTIRKEA